LGWNREFRESDIGLSNGLSLYSKRRFPSTTFKTSDFASYAEQSGANQFAGSLMQVANKIPA
jgi:hypothetical protein